MFSQRAKKSGLDSWLTAAGLDKYIPVFKNNEINEGSFILLTDADLQQMGIVKVGPRKQILARIAELKVGTQSSPETQRSLLSKSVDLSGSLIEDGRNPLLQRRASHANDLRATRGGWSKSNPPKPEPELVQRAVEDEENEQLEEEEDEGWITPGSEIGEKEKQPDYDEEDADEDEWILPDEPIPSGRRDLTMSKITHELATRPEREIEYESLDIKEQIGQGNFGIVLKAEWKGQIVVVKKMLCQSLSEKQLMEFKSELNILMDLPPHPNVIKFLGVCNKPPNLCLVTEFINNGDLLNLLRNSSLPMKTKLRCALGTAAGIGHLHNQHILHCDLAARNILVARVGDQYDVKVTDFGLSKRGEYYNSSTAFGPLKWMSPEAIDPEKSRFSKKSDVWSFGVVCWEILSDGKTPFENLNAVEAGMLIMMGKRLAIPPGTPPVLEKLLKECWLADPGERPNFDEIVPRLLALYEQYEEGVTQSYSTREGRTKSLSRTTEEAKIRDDLVKKEQNQESDLTGGEPTLRTYPVKTSKPLTVSSSAIKTAKSEVSIAKMVNSKELVNVLTSALMSPGDLNQEIAKRKSEYQIMEVARDICSDDIFVQLLEGLNSLPEKIKQKARREECQLYMLKIFTKSLHERTLDLKNRLKERANFAVLESSEQHKLLAKLEEISPPMLHPVFTGQIVDTVVGFLRPTTMQEAFKEGSPLSTAAAELLLQISRSNYDAVFKLVVEKNLINYGSKESESGSNFDYDVTVGLKGMAYLHLNEVQLGDLLGMLVRCVENKAGAFRKQKPPARFYKAFAKSLNTVIWNWIDNHPLEFGKFCKLNQRLNGGPDKLFDFFDHLAATNSRFNPKKHKNKAFWEAKTSLLLLCPDILMNIAKCNQLIPKMRESNTLASIEASKDQFLHSLQDTIKHPKTTNKTRTIVLRCLADIVKATSCLPNNPPVGLHYLSQQMENLLESNLFSPQNTPKSSSGSLQMQFMSDVLITLFRTNMKHTVHHLFGPFLTQNYPPSFKLILANTIKRIHDEAPPVPWQPTFASLRHFVSEVKEISGWNLESLDVLLTNLHEEMKS